MKKLEDRPPALLFGLGLSLLGVLRSMASAKIQSLVASDGRDFVTWSRFFRRIPGGPCSSRSSEELACDLDRLTISKAVLIPGSDMSSLAIAGLPPEIADRFPSSMASLDVQTLLTDKTKFYSVAKRLEIPHPETIFVKSRDEVSALPDSAFKDAFWKPSNSQQFVRDFRAKAFICDGKEDALRIWDRVSAFGYQLLLQKYVPGPPTSHFFIDGFMDREGKIRALFARQRLRMNPPEFGNSSYMVSVDLDDVEPAVESVLTILGQIDYRGIFSAEFKRDENDGVFKIIEINARPWIFIRFAQQCGVNVCELAYRDALGLSLPEMKSYNVGKRCVYPRKDFGACVAHWRKQELSVLNWIESWITSSKPVFEWTDPGPAIKEVLLQGRRFITRSARRSEGENI